MVTRSLLILVSASAGLALGWCWWGVASAPQQPRHQERSTDALVADLDRAVQAGDRAGLRAAVQALGARDDPRGVAALAALVMAQEPALPDGSGPWFAVAMRSARTPGLAEAARRRMGEEIARGDYEEPERWLEVVAAAGDAEQIQWLVDGAGYPPPRDSAMQAVSGATNPIAVARFRQDVWADTDVDWTDYVELHARAHPEAAPALLREWAVKAHAGLEAGQRPRDDLGEFLRVLAEVVEGEADVESFKAFLRSLGIHFETLDCVLGAIEVLAERGIRVADLRTILDAPVEAIERLAKTGWYESAGRDAGDYVSMIEFHEVTWTERAARAADAVDASRTVEGYRRGIGKSIRKALAPGWSRPVPREPSD